MYNVPRGPTRIINRTRRDISQKLESLDQRREFTRKSSVTEDALHITMSLPQPVFQSAGGGGGGKGGRSTNGRTPPQDGISPQHEELIRFFNESWGRDCKELEMGKQNGHDGRGNGITYYEVKSEHPALQGFKPFDFESWWGKRLYQSCTQST